MYSTRTGYRAGQAERRGERVKGVARIARRDTPASESAFVVLKILLEMIFTRVPFSLLFRVRVRELPSCV